MTPVEIHEYKLRWKPGFRIKLHSDLDWKGKTWCRKNLQRHQWSMTSWTAVYEHTFNFEHQKDAQAFKVAHEDFASEDAP